MRKPKKAPNRESQSPWITALLNGGIGLAVILISALISPLILLKSQNPDSLVLPMALICVAAGGVVGGTLSARASKGSELVSALITALIMFVPMIIISFLYKKGFSALGFVLVAVTLFAATILSAFGILRMGNNKKRNMKKLTKARR